jgi:hypothetical protein
VTWRITSDQSGNGADRRGNQTRGGESAEHHKERACLSK